METRRLDALRADMSERTATGPRRVGTVRVDVRHVTGVRFEATCWEGGGQKHVIRVDEPSERGGDGLAPAPLSYFVAGAASCLLTQYAKLAALEQVAVTGLELIARGHFDRSIGGSFEDVIFDVRITSNENPGRIRELSERAEQMCFASSTLKKCLTLTTNVYHNGTKI